MIQIHMSGIDSLITDFDKYVRLNARHTRTALNEASRSAQSKVLQETRKPWKGIRARDYKSLTKLFVAKGNKFETTFIMTSRSISLAMFAVNRQAKSGVAYKLKNKQRTMKGSFMAKGMFFKRRTKARDSIVPYFSITPTSMFINGGGEKIYFDRLKEVFTTNYLKYVDSNFSYATTKK